MPKGYYPIKKSKHLCCASKNTQLFTGWFGMVFFAGLLIFTQNVNFMLSSVHKNLPTSTQSPL